MQYVNNDNEDVFRSAAEGYSLSSRGMDWEKMKAKMAEPEGASTADRKRSGSWAPMIALLLLAALPWLQLQQDKILGLASAHSSVGGFVSTPEAKGVTQPMVADQRRATPDNRPARVLEKTYQNNSLTVFREMFEPRPSSDMLLGKESTSYQSDKWNHGIVSRFPQAFHAVLAPASFRDVRDIKNAVKVSAVPAKQSHRFYIAAVGGLDKTTVDLQSAHKTGKQYGLMLGYGLSRKFSLEAGLMMDRKYYYTEGSYLNKDRIYLPPNSKILDASGDCSMFEVPVLLRFRPFDKLSHLSFSAGAVSYIMKRESYDYLYYYGNSGTSAVHSWTYNNSGSNLISAAQASVAYEWPVTSKLHVRVEPYVNIPIQGMGYSKLKLMSTGLHLGLVQHIP